MKPASLNQSPFLLAPFLARLIDKCQFQMTGSNKTMEYIWGGVWKARKMNQLWPQLSYGSLQDAGWGGRCRFHHLRFLPLGMGWLGTKVSWRLLAWTFMEIQLRAWGWALAPIYIVQPELIQRSLGWRMISVLGCQRKWIKGMPAYY